VTGYSTITERLQTILPTVPISGPVIQSLQTPYQAPGQQMIYNRCHCETCCQLLARDTWHWLILCQDTNLSATVGQILKHPWWLNGGLLPICQIYITVYIQYSVLEHLLPYFLKLLCTYTMPIYPKQNNDSHTAKASVTMKN
jgi:hypothetical protein